MTPLRVLILGGTGEGNALAEALVDRKDLDIVTSLAGRTQLPALPPGTVRIGGFGGIEGLVQYVRDEGIRLIIDATHPYAAQISRNAAVAAAEARLPLVRLERPAWQPQAGDDWIEVGSVGEAAEVAGGFARVFLTVGSGELPAFAAIPGTCFVVRLIDLPRAPLPLAAHEIILARGPFAEEEERRLLQEQAIEAVVSKNSGGPATYGKIAAARALGLPVIMVARPLRTEAQRGVPTVGTVAEALRWLQGMRAALAES